MKNRNKKNYEPRRNLGINEHQTLNDTQRDESKQIIKAHSLWLRANYQAGVYMLDLGNEHQTCNIFIAQLYILRSLCVHCGQMCRTSMGRSALNGVK